MRAGRKPLIGMIHVGALPATPGHGLSFEVLLQQAADEARTLARAGFDAVLIENMHDAPYLNRGVGPEITACMTAVAIAVRAAAPLPLGIQILAGANREALAAALASGACFIRAEGFVFAHVADEGIIQSDAGELLRYRRAIGAAGIMVLADIKKKHSSHTVTADVDLPDTAHAAEFFGADGVIVTGTATGRSADPDDLRGARKGTSLPVIVGSGSTPENLPGQWPLADGFIIGSALKAEGDWRNPVDYDRAARFTALAEKLRAGR